MLRKLGIGLAIVALVFGLVVAGVVVAQGPTPRAPSRDKDGDGVCDLCGGARDGLGGWGMRGGMMGGTPLVDTIATALDMSVADVLKEAQDKTLKQVILDHNGNPEAIVNAFVAARKAVLDKLVASGRLTPEQETALLEHIRTQATAHLDSVAVNCGGEATGHGGMMGGFGRGMRGMRGGGRGANPPATNRSSL